MNTPVNVWLGTLCDEYRNVIKVYPVVMKFKAGKTRECILEKTCIPAVFKRFTQGNLNPMLNEYMLNLNS